jgi:hypothetical protein
MHVEGKSRLNSRNYECNRMLQYSITFRLIFGWAITVVPNLWYAYPWGSEADRLEVRGGPMGGGCAKIILLMAENLHKKMS